VYKFLAQVKAEKYSENENIKDEKEYVGMLWQKMAVLKKVYSK
jgi:hypothetical protein